MVSKKQEKKEAIKEYLLDADVLVTKGRIRLDIISEDSRFDASIASDEIGGLMDELVEENEVIGYETSSKGAVYVHADNDISEFEV